MLKCGDIISGDNANYKVIEYEVRDSSRYDWVCFRAFLVLEVQRTNDLMFNLHHPYFPARAKYLVIQCEEMYYESVVKYADSDGRVFATMDRVFSDVIDIVRPISKNLLSLVKTETQKRKQR